MHRIDNATSAAALPTPQPVGPNPNSYFQPQAIVEADWLNSIQEEIVNVIASESITLDKTLRNQLLAAILQKLFQASAWRTYDHVVSYYSSTTLQILGADYSNIYMTGSRIKVIGPLTGTRYGIITTTIFIFGDTRITVLLDSGTLQNETMTSLTVANFHTISGDSLPYGLHNLKTLGSDLFLRYDSATRKVLGAIISSPTQISDDARLRRFLSLDTSTGNGAIHMDTGWFRLANATPTVWRSLVLRNVHGAQNLRCSYGINGGAHTNLELLPGTETTLTFNIGDCLDMVLVQGSYSGNGLQIAEFRGIIFNAAINLMCHYTL